MRVVARIILLVVLLVALNSWADEESEGYALERIEHEYKLLVPNTIEQDVWNYLQKSLTTKYWESINPKLSATGSVEYFQDVYFDTTNFSLLRDQNAVRRRTRNTPDATDDPKNGRSLIQVKLRTHLENVRYEIKYPLSNAKNNQANLMQMVGGHYREDLARRMRILKVAVDDLLPRLAIYQVRKRIYLELDGLPFMTLTFDEASSNVFIWREVISELEIELNELTFTNADQNRRSAMISLSAEIKERIMKAFPKIKHDQLPKYNKIYNKLDAKIPYFETVLYFWSWIIRQ